MGARQRSGRRYRAVSEESQGSGIHHESDSGISEGHSRFREDKTHHPAAAPLLDHERRGDQHHEGAPPHRGPQLRRPDRSHVRLLTAPVAYKVPFVYKDEFCVTLTQLQVELAFTVDHSLTIF